MAHPYELDELQHMKAMIVHLVDCVENLQQHVGFALRQLAQTANPGSERSSLPALSNLRETTNPTTGSMLDDSWPSGCVLPDPPVVNIEPVGFNHLESLVELQTPQTSPWPNIDAIEALVASPLHKHSLEMTCLQSEIGETVAGDACQPISDITSWHKASAMDVAAERLAFAPEDTSLHAASSEKTITLLSEVLAELAGHRAAMVSAMEETRKDLQMKCSAELQAALKELREQVIEDMKNSTELQSASKDLKEHVDKSISNSFVSDLTTNLTGEERMTLLSAAEKTCDQSTVPSTDAPDCSTLEALPVNVMHYHVDSPKATLTYNFSPDRSATRLNTGRYASPRAHGSPSYVDNMLRRAGAREAMPVVSIPCSRESRVSSINWRRSDATHKAPRSKSLAGLFCLRPAQPRSPSSK